MPSPTPDPSQPENEPKPELQPDGTPDIDPASLEGRGLPEAPNRYDKSIERSCEEVRLEHAVGWARYDQSRAPPVDLDLVRRTWVEGHSTLEEKWIADRLARAYDTWSRAFVDGLKEVLYADKLSGRDEPDTDEGLPWWAPVPEDETGVVGYGLSGDANVPPSTSHDWVLDHLLPHYGSPARLAADPREAPEIDYDLVLRMRRSRVSYYVATGLELPTAAEIDRANSAVERFPAWELAMLAAEIETSCHREMADPVDFELIHRFVRGQLHEVESGWLRRTSEKYLAWRVAILAARTEFEARGE